MSIITDEMFDKFIELQSEMEFEIEQLWRDYMEAKGRKMNDQIEHWKIDEDGDVELKIDTSCMGCADWEIYRFPRATLLMSSAERKKMWKEEEQKRIVEEMLKNEKSKQLELERLEKRAAILRGELGPR